MSFTGKVAFSARFSQQIYNLKNGQTIVFGEVITNAANAYNPSSGVFVAPLDGNYVFTWTLTTAHGKWQDSELVVGDKSVGYSVVDSTKAGDSQSATQVVVAEVKKGQNVCIRAGGRGDGEYHETRQNTFSGWML